MPVAPEMQVVAEFLQSQLPGQSIIGAQALKPSVVRSVAGDVTEETLLAGSLAPSSDRANFCC